jgi:hypothetical protein
MVTQIGDSMSRTVAVAEATATAGVATRGS